MPPVSISDSLNYSSVIGFNNAVPTSWTDETTGATTTLADSDGDGIVDDYQVAVASESLEQSVAWNPNSPLSPLILRGEDKAPSLSLREGWGELLISFAHAKALNGAADNNT